MCCGGDLAKTGKTVALAKGKTVALAKMGTKVGGEAVPLLGGEFFVQCPPDELFLLEGDRHLGDSLEFLTYLGYTFFGHLGGQSI